MSNEPRRSNRVGVEAWTSNGDDVWPLCSVRRSALHRVATTSHRLFRCDRDDQHQRSMRAFLDGEISCRRRRLGSLRRPRRPEDQLLARIRRICWSDPVVFSMTAAILRRTPCCNVSRHAMQRFCCGRALLRGWSRPAHCLRNFGCKFGARARNSHKWLFMVEDIWRGQTSIFELLSRR